MHSFRNFSVSVLFALALLAAAPAAAIAQEKEAAPAAAPDAQESQEALSPEEQKAQQAFMAALVHGPAEVKLRQATLAMPAGFVFMPREQALPVMEDMGNTNMGDGFLGLFVSEDHKEPWFVSAEFDDSGYIKDDDKDKINPDDILKGMKEGVEEDNKERSARGLPQMEIVGWIEPPHYDTAGHHLVWSVEAKDIPPAGQAADPDNGVNYNTLALGREGYISLNLVSSKSTVEQDKKKVAALLDNLKFDGGKRYEDFKIGDKVAEYGLLALIGGVVAKKVGLLAILAAVIAKGAKLLIVAAVAGAAAVKKFFSRKRNPTA